MCKRKTSAMNTSATGGYILPSPQAPLPGGLTFKQFLQQVFVGISGLDGDHVRPKWQRNPPKPPSDIDENWLAIAIVSNTPDANAFVGQDELGNGLTQRHEELEMQCSFYGVLADDLASLVRDGFQVPSNLEGLRSANMGYVGVSQAMRVPDLVNEQWRDRIEVSVFLRREIMRVYPILTFITAGGTIHTVVNGDLKTLAWNAVNRG
jgi:hypothetical protein